MLLLMRREVDLKDQKVVMKIMRPPYLNRRRVSKRLLGKARLIS